MKTRIIAINDQNKETDFNFVGQYRTQTKSCVSWNYEGMELFERIPCGNCKSLFTERDLNSHNYHLWTDDKFSWIDKKFNLYWDRYLINYQVKDKENNCRNNFPDGKQLVLKLGFVITNIIHKIC